MFMESFENSNKQQQRRQQRQLALQRMEEAASIPNTPIEEEDAGDGDDIENLHSSITAIDNAAVAGSNTTRSNAVTSAANFLSEQQDSYSFEPASAAARQFLWDDQTAYSSAGSANLSPRQRQQAYGNTQQGKSTSRWNTITSGAGGLWSALPVWGGGQQVVDTTNTANSGGDDSGSARSSKYRDVEGERLLTLASERVKIDNISALDREFGEHNHHVDDDGAGEEDYDSQLRRRVFLDKNGTMNYDKSGGTGIGAVEALRSRRMRNTCLRVVKRPAILICAVGVVIASMTMYNNFMARNSVPTSEGEEIEGNNDLDDTKVEIPTADISGGPDFKELEVDGAKIDVDKERFDHIKYVIIESKASTPEALQDTKSAQFAALLWLVREDPRHLAPDNAYLLQRYGLAVLWFSTTKNKYYHISEEYEASNSVENNENRRWLEGQDMDKWFNHDDWLSGLGVCGWTGIKCYPHDDGLDSNGDNDGDVMEIDLRRNNLRGAFPSDLFRTLPFLKSLDLSDNALAGTISDDIGKMSNLQFLNFTANNFAGSIPDGIGNVPSLRVFHMSSNRLDNVIPTSMYKLASLKELDLSRNSLVATIPHEIGALTELTSLNLSYNSLEGPLPHEISNMRSLMDLDVSYNKLQGSLPNEIGFVSYLRSLNLSHNQFEDVLPTVLGNLEHLENLYLNDNEFKGSIPTELSKLAELDVLNLANNHLTGLFPVWLTHLYDLQELDVSHNAIKGEISRSIADMKNLRIFNMAGNDLVGIIPPELGGLFKLEQISLETNELVGGIPAELGELTSLRKLALHNNYLTGHVSDNVCKLSNEMFLTQFTVDCAGETAVIICECCQCQLHENIIHLNNGNNRYET
jgi:Leucine-rich repeat (LRR) protein